ncbi:hypothetical protein [Plantactinospora sp. CA-290183]|uniref:hypothetical protein n=1 Tax=Plantactinospora sp. CA-290183 TaxID=3240006 RepID=UPI003D8A49E9
MTNTVIAGLSGANASHRPPLRAATTAELNQPLDNQYPPLFTTLATPTIAMRIAVDPPQAAHHRLHRARLTA